MNKLQIIILILLVGLLFRGMWFGQIPAGISDDEASQGYTAYSILNTGGDEYGKSWPLFNRSFGTYASNLYTYLTIPVIKIFDLGIGSTRAVSLVSGLLTILAASVINPMFGLVVAISPVFVFYSRAAFETNLALSLMLTGILLVVKQKKYGLLLIVLSAYAYHVERFIVPILLLFLVKKTGWKSFIIAILLLIPLGLVSLTPGAQARSDTVGGNLVDKLFLASNYFSINNLFSRPDPSPNKSFPEVSVFYWWMVIPLIYGIKRFLTRPKTEFEKILVVVSLGSVAIASATQDYFSTWRALPFLSGVAYLISLGLPKSRIILALVVLLSFSTIYANLILQKFEQSTSWGYHYKSLAKFIKDSDKKIIIDNARSNPIYIWLAFYNQVDPQLFYKDSTWLESYYDHVAYEPVSLIGQVEIRPIEWKTDIYIDQILISDNLGISQSQIEEHYLTPVGTFVDTSGGPVLNAYSTNPELKLQSVTSLLE